MKIYIALQIPEGPTGGGYQFLRQLRNDLIRKKSYTNSPENADIILFNSYHDYKEIYALKRKYNNKIFVHRVDGPIKLYNHPNDKRDLITNALNKHLADATIFQSKWSRQKSYTIGLERKQYENVILNAPAPFFSAKQSVPKGTSKIKIVSTSWSKNIKKGFEYYRFLDQNLDFTRYDYTFIGNSPYVFKNIKMIPPVDSRDLSELLRQANVFVTASKKDPCSNALIEAIHCGLLPIAYRDGGHPEIVAESGLLFDNCNQLIQCIEDASEILFNGQQKPHSLPTMNDVSDQYLSFFADLVSQKQNILDKHYKAVDLFIIRFFLEKAAMQSRIFHYLSYLKV